MAGAIGNKQLARRKRDLANSKAPEVAEMWLQGFSYRKIQSITKLSIQTIARLISDARKAWLERKNLALADAIAEQLKRVDLIEAKAWEEFEKSKNPARKNSVKATKAGIEKTFSTEERVGDPRFLDVGLKCVEQRCKLLGIYKPPEERAEINVWGVTVVVDTSEQAESILEYEQFKSIVVDDPPVVQQPAIEFDQLVTEPADVERSIDDELSEI